jgi:hypothetical protein
LTITNYNLILMEYHCVYDINQVPFKTDNVYEALHESISELKIGDNKIIVFLKSSSGKKHNIIYDVLNITKFYTISQNFQTSYNLKDIINTIQLFTILN